MTVLRIITITALLIFGKTTIMAQSTISDSISAITEIIPKKGKEKDVKMAVKFIQAETSKQTGCLLFSLSSKQDEPDTFVMFEIFKSQEALDAHKKQAHTIRFGKLLEGKYEKNNVTFLNTINTYYH